MNQPRLTVIPVTWKQACAFVEQHHRHHAGTRGCKWAVGVADEDGHLRGVALAGRPVSRHLDDGLTVEVNRTCTDGCPNANSALYGACWRIAAAMGYRRMITYTLTATIEGPVCADDACDHGSCQIIRAQESGVSLRAAGLRKVRDLPARGSWAASSVALKHLRDPEGAGGMARTLWEREAS